MSTSIFERLVLRKLDEILSRYVAPLPLEKADELARRIATLESRIQALGGIMSQLDDAIAALTATVTAETTVEASAVTLLNGIPGLIASAVQQAQAQGATPAQLAAITALGATIQTSSATLAAAVTTNTPAAPAPAPTPVPAPAPTT